MSGRPADALGGFGLDEQWRRRGIADGNEGVAAWTPEPSPDGWHSGVGAWAAVDDDGWEGQPDPDWLEDDGEKHDGSGTDPDDLDVWDDEHCGAGSGRGARHRSGRRRRRRPKGSIHRRRLVVAVATILVVTLTVGAAALIRHISLSSVPTALTAKSPARPGTTAPDAGGRFELSTGSVSPGPNATPTKSAASQPAAPASGAGVPGNVPGWRLTYSTDFPGSSLPSNWGPYSGRPGNDPDGNWNPADVAVSGGELHFYASNGSTGGVSFGGNPQTYGMYQVRMKGDYEPGIDISDILLLWPDSSVWPPEIDFFEDTGGARSSYLATVHPGPNGQNSNQVHVNVNNNATQWHTYGVQWTPSTITFTVDGQSVGSVSQSDTGAWPDIAMNLDLQSQNLGPSQPANGTETMTVAWVAEYAMS